MKLGELKNKIRHAKGAPKVTVHFPDGHSVVVMAQKSSLLAELDAHFGGGRVTETGLLFTEDGLLTADVYPSDAPDAHAVTPSAASVDSDDIDLDDDAPVAPQVPVDLELDEIDDL